MPEGEIRKSSKKEPAMLKTATSGGGKGKAASGTHMLHHIEITPTEPETKGGPPGFSVEHHYDNSGSMGSYKQPDTHAFSPGHGAKLIKHLKKHLGLAYSDATEGAENEGEKE
jgi:hypothetical protein